jgi:hypothetical protein
VTVSVGLRGNLQDFGIAEVFQLIGQQRKTGVLEIAGEGETVRLCFDRGAVVSAAPVGRHDHAALGEMLMRCGRLTREQLDLLERESAASAQAPPRIAVARGWLGEEDLHEIEDLLTRETFVRILRWEQGSFHFNAQEVEHHRQFESLLGAEQILMDGLRMVDEWQSFEEHVPSESMVFASVGDFAAYRQVARDEAPEQLEAARRVLGLVDGRLSVRRIIDLSMLGTFDAMRILANLRSAEIIEPLDVGGVHELRQQWASSLLRRENARGWVAGILPLALLLLIAAFAQGEAPGAPKADGIAVHRSSFDSAREAFAARRVRHALETYRFIDRRWPRRLAQLENRGIVTDTMLATPSGHPYYYVVREEGAVLLAPER